MHFNCVTGLDPAKGSVTVGGVLEFGWRQRVRIIAFIAAMLSTTSGYGKAGPFMLGIGVGVDVAQIHLRGGRRQREDARVGAFDLGDIPRRLRTEALTQFLRHHWTRAE